MNPSIQSPVTPQMLVKIKEFLAQEPRLRQEIDKAKAIGLDMSAQEAKLNQTIEQMKKILTVYGQG